MNKISARQKGRIVRIIAAAAAAALVGVALTAQIVVSEPRPPRPEWVNEDGTIDFDRMPERLPRMNEKGEVVGTAKLKRGAEPEAISEPLMPTTPRAQR